MSSSAKYTQYIEYTAQEGDTWEKLAYRFYGNCFDYARLIMCNPDVAISLVIEPGTKLVIPVFEDNEESAEDKEGLPLWKQA